EVADNKKDKNSNLQAKASHKLQKLQRQERQNQSRAEALVVANYWAISRSEEAAQEANYQALLTQSDDPNNSDSTETNQWLWQLVPYRPPQKPSQPNGHRHILPGAHRPSVPSKSIHSVASKTVNLLLNNWTNGGRNSEDMKTGRSSSRKVNMKTESENGDAYSDSGESEDEESTLSLNENSENGSSISSGKRVRSSERSSSQDKDIERKPVVGAPTGKELIDRAETSTVEAKPTVEIESKTPSSHNPSPKVITVPPPFSGLKGQKRTEDVRPSVVNHASTDPLESEPGSNSAQASPVLEALSVSSNYLDLEEDGDDVNPSDSGKVVIDIDLSDSGRVVPERRQSRRISRRLPNSAHRRARSAHSDSMATPKPYPPMHEANHGFVPSAHFPGPPQMHYGPVQLAAPIPYQAQFPPFSDPAIPPPIHTSSPKPPAPSETAEQIERLEKILVEYIARDTASKEAIEAAVAQERNAKAAQETEKEQGEVKLRERAKKEAEEEAKKQNEKKQVLSLKDAIGRKFRFPFHQCKTWDGISYLITTAFIHVDVLGSHVANGHYDLVGPSGETILPTIWETVVEPGWSVSMSMWPVSETKDARPRTLAPEVVDGLEESSPQLASSSLNPSKRGSKREKPAVEEDEVSLSSEDISVDERSQLLRILEQVEVSDLQQWIEDKKRVLEEKSKQSKARETAVDFYSGASDVGALQQRFSRPEPSLEQSRDGGAFQQLSSNTEEQFKRVEQMLLENKRDQELKEMAEQKLKEQAYIDHLKKQIEDKQAKIDAREAAAQVEKEEQKYARLEKLIMDRNTPQQGIPSQQLTLPISNISRPESSTSTNGVDVDVVKNRSFRNRIFSRGSSAGSVKR
ncbi:MAG: hypothetical protein Q9214_003992, partial [Letrouitia sp. 1 TL-2023]